MHNSLVDQSNKKPKILFFSDQLQKIGAALTILLKLNLEALKGVMGAFAPILGPVIIAGYFLEALGSLVTFYTLNNKHRFALLELIYTILKVTAITIAILSFAIWLPLLVPAAMAGVILFNLGCLYQHKLTTVSSDKSIDAEENINTKLQETVLAGLLLIGLGLLTFFPGPLAFGVACFTVGAYLLCIASACYQQYGAPKNINSPPIEIHPVAEKTPEEIQNLSKQLLEKAAQLLVQIKNSEGTWQESLWSERQKRDAKIFVLIASCLLLNKFQAIDLLSYSQLETVKENASEIKARYAEIESQLKNKGIKDYSQFSAHKEVQFKLRKSCISFFQKKAATTELVEQCFESSFRNTCPH